MSTERVLLLSARKYDFVDKDRQIKGVTVTYVEPYAENSEDARGFKSMKMGATDEVWAALEKGPCFADVEIGRRPDKDGKATNFMRSAKPVSPLKFVEAK